MDTSLGHFRAIARLVGAGMYGSAFALWRPQFETLVRGTWLAQCASASLVEGFLEDPKFEFPKVNAMLVEMQEFSVEVLGELQWVKDRYYKLMHDLTHGGRQQAFARYGQDGIGECIPDDDAVKLLSTSAIMAVMAADVILRIGDEGATDRSVAVARHLHDLMAKLLPAP